MTSLALTSELDAVNTMLACIGEAPISSLSMPGLVEADQAKLTLDEVSRMVQGGEWHFNTESNYPLYPDALTKEITLPANTLEVDVDGRDLVQRGTRLYDRSNHTYAIGETLKAHIKFLLPWDELPQALRDYLMIRAARVFQARHLGSDTQHKFSEDAEVHALANAKRHDLTTADLNILTGSADTAYIVYR